jgi:hypothetical protein
MAWVVEAFSMLITSILNIDAYFYSPPPKFLLINFSYNSISLSGMRLVALPGKRATGAHSLDLLIKYQLYELKCALPLS